MRLGIALSTGFIEDKPAPDRESAQPEPERAHDAAPQLATELSDSPDSEVAEVLAAHAVRR